VLLIYKQVIIGYVASAGLAICLILAQYIFVFEPDVDPLEGAPSERQYTEDNLADTNNNSNKEVKYKANIVDDIIVYWFKRFRMRSKKPSTTTQQRLERVLRKVGLPAQRLAPANKLVYTCHE
jgi:hypothetical protein